MTTAREQWLEARRSGLGGSDMGAILGLSPWQSALALYTERLGLTEPIQQTERMAWGHRHERTISDWYEAETGRMQCRNFMAEELRESIICDEEIFTDDQHGRERLWRSREIPWQIGTPDRFIWDEPTKSWGVLEIKCAAFGKREWQDGPPPHYMAQLQSYLALSGLQWGSFAVMFSLYESGWIDVERDDESIAKMLAIAGDFWRRLQENDPPEPDASDSSRKALSALLGRQTDDEVALPHEGLAWDEEFITAHTEMKAAEKRKKAAENKIRAAMGTASACTLPSGVRWTSTQIEATANKRAHRRYYRKEAT